MNDNRTGGMLLTAGSAAFLITMGFHPVGPHGGVLPSPHALAILAAVDRAVHTLAIAALPLLFLGAMALTQRLAGASRLALAALVVYGFAAVAIMSAACMSGFVGADILSRMVEGDPKLESRHMLLDYTFRLNQAYASVYAVGSCVAIFLWSLEMVRTRRLSTGLGNYGLVLAPLLVAALCSGHLTLDVHGAGLLAILEGVWFITAGILLMRDAGKDEVVPDAGASSAGPP